MPKGFCSFSHRHGEATVKPMTRDETTGGSTKTSISRETCHKVPQLPRETKQRNVETSKNDTYRHGHTVLTRTVANGCGRLRTVATTNATSSEHTLSPQTPRVKREPLLRIREKQLQQCWMVWVEKLNTIVRTLAMDQTDQPQNGRLPTQTDFDPNPCSNILIQTHVATRPRCVVSAFGFLLSSRFFPSPWRPPRTPLSCSLSGAASPPPPRLPPFFFELLVSVKIGDAILQFVITITASQKVVDTITASQKVVDTITASIIKKKTRHHHGIYKKQDAAQEPECPHVC